MQYLIHCLIKEKGSFGLIIFEIFTDYYRYFLRGAQATILLSLAVFLWAPF